MKKYGHINLYLSEDSVNVLREFALRIGLEATRGTMKNVGNVSGLVRLIVRAIKLGRITEDTFKGLLNDR